jgi:hypothetical protein
MSKFPLNLLLQISKALLYSKIKFYSEKNFPHFRPNRPSNQLAHPDFQPSRSPFFPFQTAVPPPSPQGLGLSAGPAHLTAQPATLFLLPHQSQTHKAPPPADLVPPPRSTPMLSTGGKKRPHQSPFIPPLIDATPPLQTLVTGAFKPGPLKLLQCRTLKVPGLPRLASAL